MFTGLIQDIGRIDRIDCSLDDASIRISTAMKNFSQGESIAVNGVCLTVSAFDHGAFEAFASKETLDITGLGRLSTGTPVNLERALRLNDRLGGHMVSGHVDAQVMLLEKIKLARASRLRFSLPSDPATATQIAVKGSVAIDGVSLTINDVNEKGFEVMVVPVTLSHTTLHGKTPGDHLNIETDIIAKYINRMMGTPQKPKWENTVDMDMLLENGFVR